MPKALAAMPEVTNAVSVAAHQISKGGAGVEGASGVAAARFRTSQGQRRP